MDIIQALKSDEAGVRVTIGWRWLYWDSDSFRWVVMEKGLYVRKSKIIIETPDQDAAVAALLGEDQ